MSSYTLYYFDGRGRAEICRMLFAAAGVQYADKRIELKNWDYLKSKMPCSMVPVLEIDGDMMLPQSMAIARYLAREFAFYGKNNVDMTRIDYVCNSFYNIIDDYLRLYQDKDGCMMFDKFADIRQKYKNIDSVTGLGSDSWSGIGISKEMMMEMLWRYQETCRRVLPFLERVLKMYNNGNLYFMGDRMTIADMMCYVALENPVYDNPNLLDRYPKLSGLRTRIATHQKILPYLKRRPKTDF